MKEGDLTRKKLGEREKFLISFYFWGRIAIIFSSLALVNFVCGYFLKELM